jgi:drug/metabolite transporter (DMT)-like permease
MLANTAGTIMGRSLNRMGSIPPLVLTGISMAVGVVMMLGAGLAIEGIPTISLLNWAAIVWMAVVNTAMAFTLWNYTQRTLQATESSIIANMMTVFVAILGWIFVGEGLSTLDIFGIVAVTIGTMLVQIRRFRQINLQTGI